MHSLSDPTNAREEEKSSCVWQEQRCNEMQKVTTCLLYVDWFLARIEMVHKLLRVKETINLRNNALFLYLN